MVSLEASSEFKMGTEQYAGSDVEHHVLKSDSRSLEMGVLHRAFDCVGSLKLYRTTPPMIYYQYPSCITLTNAFVPSFEFIRVIMKMKILLCNKILFLLSERYKELCNMAVDLERR